MHIDEANLIRCATLLSEWETLVTSGWLTNHGMMAVRHRLKNGNEFDARRAEADLLLLGVVETLKARNGLTDWPFPGEGMPGDARELDPGNSR